MGDWQGRTREAADGLRSRERKSADQRMREAAERETDRASSNRQKEAPETERQEED